MEKAKMSFSKARGLKKAFLFSIDALVAVIILFLLLTAAVYYAAKGSEDPLSQLHTIRIGSDILALLDHQGALGSLSVENISIELNSLLPVNHEMAVSIECGNKDPLAVETSESVPQNRFIGAGKRVFLAKDFAPCIAGYQIWLK
ncbi:hypothetical protein HYU14_05600 [Candidatus Woesearchaeota archaeon]|nr:hypothetical protein [Candidatus Woesearchaeota archaeon]